MTDIAIIIVHVKITSAFLLAELFNNTIDNYLTFSHHIRRYMLLYNTKNSKMWNSDWQTMSNV